MTPPVELTAEAVLEAGLEPARDGPAWLEDAARPRRARSRSLIAGANALFRMSETRRPEASRILSDPFAGELAEGATLQVLRYARFLLPPLAAAVAELQTAHCVRHRSIDELTLRAVDAGYRQVVVLGAGYDMRPSRFAERLSGVDWYEVDLPALSARKRALVEALPGTRAGVRYVPFDLGSGGLGEALAAAGFDAARPACFILEGLVHYLGAPALDALLGAIATGAGPRRAILSFIRTDVYLAVGSSLRELFRVMREIPRLHFTWTELAAACARHGLRRFEAWSYADQVARFAPVARGRRVGSAQDVGQVDREG